jgi:hypothetical protein
VINAWFALRIKMTDDRSCGEARYYKFIVISAFQMTSSNSQEKWFDHVRVYILGLHFGDGQIYVALTRERNRQYVTLHITGMQTQGKVMRGWNI